MGQALEVSLTIGLNPSCLSHHVPPPAQWPSLTSRHRVGAGLDRDGRSLRGTVHNVTCKAGLGSQAPDLGGEGKKSLAFSPPPQESKYTLGSITKDISLPENVLP